MKLKLYDYKYYPYEKKFLEAEITKFGGNIVRFNNTYVEVENLSAEDAKKITYVEAVIQESERIATIQAKREAINGKSSYKHQSTRYGPHGLHDYKGKFNPQAPRSLMVQNFGDSRNLLDPFMGSGTTMVEARSLGLACYGVELNPFAYEITKAKLSFEEIEELPELKITTDNKKRTHAESEYLLKWFTEEQYQELLYCLEVISEFDEKIQRVLKIILSDQLRKNSLQDPKDLRVRRLKERPTTSNIVNDFIKRYTHLRDVHSKWIKLNGVKQNSNYVFNDTSEKLDKMIKQPIDGTVSSPPYFSALPYVDTYRLSMVALGFIEPSQISKAERSLIGARDITKAQEADTMKKFANLPTSIQDTTNQIISALNMDQHAGFRKKAVPYNLVRYCNSILTVLSSLYKIERKGARNLWVVGPNKTNIGNESFIIDTPNIIADLAHSVGFQDVELEAVDAYSRYDIHSKNSIRHEYIVKFNK